MSANSNISPEPIFQMITGFWVSKALMAAVELEVFTKISGKQVTLQQLQDILEMEQRPTDVFATSLASLGLLKVTTENGRRLYSNSALADLFLDKNKSSYMGDIVTMFDKRLYKGWDKLVLALKTNKPVSAEEGGGAETIFDQAKSKEKIEEIKKFTHSMHGVSIGPAMALAKSFDFSKYRKMVDIGGGSGVYCIEVVKRNPNISAVVLDLEPVCQVAQEYIGKFNLQDKIQTTALDFWKEPLPSGYDVAFLSHILHDYDQDKDTFLLKKICDSLNDDGVVLISEWLINDEKTGPPPSALMGLNMIVESYGGRNYSFAEISKMLKTAGFKRIEKRPLATPAELIVGYKS
ncbi:MAG: hypothetical protein AUH71_03875 [Thaumarchaeota archaeon 13_1_40CM_4_48_7]|nr:MAG: hypothetical protein AUH71_03875 [Thaumarchaeota archaeon 13_1_40CM_4_48_7]